MKNITDSELYELCKKFGKQALEARRRFAGLLPEVFKRHLYEKKGFSSIYEFSAKLAGMSHDQVDLVLRLERKFEDKPILQKALTDGEISANKLVRIASIATAENQEEIFEKAKILSNRALEVFVRDVRNWRRDGDGDLSLNENSSGNGNENENVSKNQNLSGSLKPIFGQKMHVQTLNLNGSMLNLDEDIEKELFEMQEKGIDINEFLRNALKKRKKEIEDEKIKIAEEQEQKIIKKKNIAAVMGAFWAKENFVRTKIPIKIQKIIHEEHGTKCSVPGCTRLAKTLHHTGRFALTKSHNPYFIAPLCEEHHEIAHKIDLKFLQKSMV